jgi:site-specific recombinase XerD
MADGKYSAAVAALTVKAKLAGLWIDKAENNANNVVYHIADHPLTMDEWAAKYCSPGENISIPFLIHSHQLRHSTGYKLANDGQDTRAIQGYLGHRSIMSTQRYTALASDRFKRFWKD